MHDDAETWFNAIEKNTLQTVKQYINSGFNIETRDKHQQTALLAAVAFNRPNIVLLLLENGADYTVRDMDEWSVIHSAVHEDNIGLIDIFHKIDARLILSQRWNGVAPLHMASSATAVKKLVSLGAPIEEEENIEGYTPLMEAVFQENQEVAICLIKHGANILHINYKGNSVLDVAASSAPEIFPLLSKIVNPGVNDKGHRTRASKTEYNKNITNALAATQNGLDIKLVEIHASRRVDLLFFLLIAYYKSNLTVKIEDTHLQHGKGNKKNRTQGCHSALLPAVYDTVHTAPAHKYNTRYNHKTTSYRTSILDSTDFKDSLNATVELDLSVNYFDTNYIEGRANASDGNEKMRIRALAILNQVSSGEIDPILGMEIFLKAMYRHLMAIKLSYLQREELPSSPRATRLQIYNAEFKGTFFSSCNFDNDRTRNPSFELQNDYICSHLPFSKKDRTMLLQQQDLKSPRNKLLLEEAYVQVKEDMDLPVQYQRL